MLKSTKELYGTRIGASDGDIGHVKDFYFDDKNWVVRYLIADTGSWLAGRLVLLSPHAFSRFGMNADLLKVNLTKSQIENSPPIDSHKPVSRQYEVDYYNYYGWPAYWNGVGMWGMGAYPLMVPPSKTEIDDRQPFHHRQDKHLQSALAITGYAIQAVDGQIGDVSALMIDDRSWAVPEFAVKAGHWFSGKEVLVSTKSVTRISYEESKVFVSLTMADIERTAPNDLAIADSGPFGATGFHD